MDAAHVPRDDRPQFHGAVINESAENRKATQRVINSLVVDPLKHVDGKTKTE